MAIIARDQVTLVDMTDIESVITYYLKQSSTASPPSAPTTNPPSGSWVTTEPSYSSGETSTLYTVICTTFSNGDFDYSDVSVSSAYEAAKEAYNRAVAAGNAAESAQASINQSNELILGTQTSSVAAWTGVSTTISELSNGLSINYWTPYAGQSNITLNLTLKNGTTTGAIPCYYGGTTRLGTHYGAGNVVHLTYRTNVTIGSTTIAQGWWADANYANSNTYDRTYYNGAIKAGSTAVVAGNIIVAGANNAGTYTHLKLGNPFDVTYPILYASSNIAVGSTSTSTYITIPFTVTTTQSITLTATKAVYIKGTISGTTFTPISTTPLTQTVPNTNDGYSYMFLGTAYSTTAMYLMPEHKIYRYYNGGFKTTEQIAVEAATAASNAQSTADQALTSANGKNKIYHQASQPSGGTYITGDTWFDTDDSYKMYTYNGTSWVAEQFGSNAIVASAIKTSHIDAGAVTAAKIQSHTITATQLATDAIKSSNYQASSNVNSPYSATGTFINLSDGNIYTPNFGVDNTNGKAYINGEIIATSGSIGNSSSNYWEIGTKTDYNMAQSAALIAHGTSYIQSGVLQLSGDKLNTQSYNSERNITYPSYEYYWDFDNQRDTVDFTYYDFGMQSPKFDTSESTYVAGVSDLFLYGRRHKTTIPSIETDWEYLFKVDKDGTIYENGVKLSDKYALITDVGSAYLPTTGGTISGNLTVTGTLTANASSAKQTVGSLSINGKSFNGSTNVTVGTLGVGYGGTGATSFTSGSVLIGNGSNAIQTRSIINNTSVSHLGWTSGNGTYIPTLNTIAYFNGEFSSGKSNLLHFRLSSDNTSYTFGSMASKNADEYLPIVGGTLYGPLNINDSLTAVSASLGDLVVTGSGRFTNGIYGNLTGNADTATKATGDGDGNTISTTYLKKSGGTMTGTLTLLGNQYTDGYSGALNANNSDIYNLNSLYTMDAAEDAREGFHFYRDATHVDTFWVKSGVMYFVPNRTIGTGTTTANSNVVLHSGNYNSYAPTLTGTGASGTWGINISGTAGTATNVSGTESTNNTNAHVWFSNPTTETKRSYSGNFMYNPSTDTLTVGNITGNAATATTAGTATTANSATKATQDGDGNVISNTYLKKSGGTMSGNLTVSTASSPTINITSTASSGGSATIGMLRQNASSWKIVNDASFKIQNNWSNNSAGNYFDVVTLAYSTGNMTVKGTVTAPTFVGALTGNASTATSAGKWTNSIALTVGDTSHNIDGSGAVSFTKAEIAGNATAQSAGWMSASDKSKLDSINISDIDDVVTADTITGSDGVNVSVSDGIAHITGTFKVPTTSGTNGQLIVSNGTTGVWTSAGTVANNLANALSVGSSQPTDNDYYIAQYAGGGTSTTTYHRRTHSALWGYISGKINNTLGLNSTNYGGTAAKANKLTSAVNISVGDITHSFDGSSGLSYATADMGIITSDIKPIKTKTFSNVICTANNDPNGWLYFGTVMPTVFDKQWHIKYKLNATINGTVHSQDCIVEIYGVRESYVSYMVYNSITNTSYRPLYAHLLYTTTTAGNTAGYPHLLGLRFQSSYNPTTTANSRVIDIEVLLEENCSISFYDEMKLYSAISGNGTTNYKTRTSFDGTTNGVTISGDRNSNTYDRTYLGTTRVYAGENGILPYTIILQDGSGAWQSCVLSSDYTSTNKPKNTSGFMLRQVLYNSYSAATAKNALTVNNYLYVSYPTHDIRYDTNTTSTSLTPNKSFYFVFTLGSDGLFYLADTWWTQTLPSTEDNKYYLYIGEATSAYQVTMHSVHPVYWYTNGAVREYSESASYASEASYATTAGGSEKDGDGNTISSTYVKKNGDTMSGNLTVSNNSAPTINVTSTATSGGSANIGLLRNNLSSWKIVNDTDFKIQNNWSNSGAVNYFNVVTLAYSTGNATFKGTVTAPTFIGALNGNATSATTANSATKATQDGSGNTITSYYCTLSTAQTVSGAKTFSGTNTFSGVNSFTNTTESTSMATGAVKLSGGLGVSKNISANSNLIGDHARLSYNSTYGSLEFTFE